MLSIFKKERKVDFLIIGAQKCGTTSLYNYLSYHPDIIGSKPKEVDYFSLIQVKPELCMSTSVMNVN